jgi:cell division protein FtsI/penicillin-binding protein 2
MGQEVSATPLQIASAMCAIANGGHLMLPQIVREIVDDNGHTVNAFPPVEVRRVIPDHVSSELRSALSEVVSKKGTAQLAAVPGFTAGGKTGTAQRVGPNGTYEKEKYVCSFVGFLPADKPEFVCLVMLDSPNVPHEKNFGGMTAAPVFARIAEKTARHLDLIPSPELMVAGNANAAAAGKVPQIRD